MWVLFTKTYIGPLGSFMEGDRVDIPLKTARKLNDRCIKTVAPWEEQTDQEAIELAEARKSVVDLKAKVVALEFEGIATAYTVPFTPVCEAAKKKADKARNLADQAKARADKAAGNAEKASTPGNQARAAKLRAESDQLHRAAARAELLSDEAQATADLAKIADRLSMLDSDDAQRELAIAEERLEKLQPKKEAQENERSEQTDPEAGTEGGESTEDDSNSEGQTVPPGQDDGSVSNQVKSQKTKAKKKTTKKTTKKKAKKS